MPDSASLPSAVKLAWAFGPAPYTSRPAPVVQDPSSAIGPGHFNCSRSLHFFSPTFFLFYSPSLFYFCPSLPSVRHLEQTLLPFSYPGYAVIPYISITTVCPDRFPAARSTRRIYRRRSGLHPRRFFFPEKHTRKRETLGVVFRRETANSVWPFSLRCRDTKVGASFSAWRTCQT